MDTCFLHSMLHLLYFCFKKGFHRNLDFIWFNKTLSKIVDLSKFRLIDKLVIRLIEINIVVSGSPNIIHIQCPVTTFM